jgi:hypothetical protein
MRISRCALILLCWREREWEHQSLALQKQSKPRSELDSPLMPFQPDEPRTFRQSEENGTMCGPSSVDSWAKLAVAVVSSVVFVLAPHAFGLVGL